MITPQIALYLARLFRINLRVIPLPIWREAIEVELEHGRRYGRLADVTHDNLITTARIALAHLLEYPDYYQRLHKLESEAEKYWRKRPKPKIFL